MAKKPASALARVLVAARACVFRVDPVALEIVTSPVLVRALTQTIARQFVGRVRPFSTLPTFAGSAVVRKQEAGKRA